MLGEWLLRIFASFAFLYLVGMFWFVIVPDVCREIWRTFRGR